MSDAGSIQLILEEVLSIVEQQKVLQARLEELLITLKVKGEFGQLTPVRAVPVKVVGQSQKQVSMRDEDDDDLGPAPIGFSGDGSSLGTESGWERATPHGRAGGGGDEGPGKSSLSLSYSFSPVVNSSNLTRVDFSDGLSPAPLASSSSSSSTSTQKPSSAAAATPGLFAEAAAVLSASTLRLFGSPPRYHNDEKKPGGVSALVKEEEEDEDDDDDDEAESEKMTADESDSSSIASPSPIKKEAVSAELRAEREAQAATMTMSALSLALGAHLAEAGAPSKQRGLKETVEDSCKILGLAVSGNLKKDAAACYAVWGPASQSSSTKPSSPSKASTHSSSTSSSTTTTTTSSSSSPSSSMPSSSSTPAVPTRTAAGLQSPASTPQTAPPPAALGIFSPTSTSSFSSRLREYYREHNPSKIHECDKIAATYSGREEVLITKLEKLYNAKFPL